MESAAQSEYKEFIYRYLLQIIGIPIQSDKTKDEIIINVDKHVPSSKYVFDAPDEKRVYFSDYSGVLFFVESKADIDKENIRAAVNIVQMFFKISEYSHSGSKGSTRIEYPSDAMRYRAYESAVQEGICRWMIGGKNPSTAKLVHTLENWSVKTYEGAVQKLISVLSILFFILGICRKIGFAAHCLGNGHSSPFPRYSFVWGVTLLFSI